MPSYPGEPVPTRGYLREDHDVVIQDERVEPIDLSDAPDLVVLQVHLSSAYRAYELADHYRRQGAHVCLGGLHDHAPVTALKA